MAGAAVDPAAASVLDVQWIPGLDDRLMMCSSELKLFRVRAGAQVHPGDEAEAATAAAYHDLMEFNKVQLGDDCVAELDCQIPEPPHYIRCVQVVPSAGGAADDEAALKGGDIRFAVGQASGRITLMSFDEVNHVGHHSHVVKEFGPRVSGRVCHGMAWNLKRPYVLAAGYEKSRNDYAILIFDTSRTSYPPLLPAVTGNPGNTASPNLASLAAATASATLSSVGFTKNSSGEDFITSVTEIGYGDACHSLAWFRDIQPDVILAGMNSKNLKAFDVRCPGTHSG